MPQAVARPPLLIHHVDFEIALRHGVSFQRVGDPVQFGVGVRQCRVDGDHGGLTVLVTAPGLDEVVGHEAAESNWPTVVSLLRYLSEACLSRYRNTASSEMWA